MNGALILLLLVVSACAKTVEMPRDNQLGQVVDMKITSAAFVNNGHIPAKYTCVGDDINPPLTIADIPGTAKSLALILDDPDAPVGTWVHWVMWNIPLDGKIPEDSAPGVQGKNSWGNNTYGGPCPPSGTHRYFFRAYALDSMLNLPNSADKKAVEKSMQGHIVAQGQLIGLFGKG